MNSWNLKALRCGVLNINAHDPMLIKTDERQGRVQRVLEKNGLNMFNFSRKVNLQNILVPEVLGIS